MLAQGQDVLSAGDGQELDQLFVACLMNGTGQGRAGSTLCEMPSAGVRLGVDGMEKSRWMVLVVMATLVWCWF